MKPIEETYSHENETNPVKIFISYCHRDEKYAKKLINHLSVLARNRLVEYWYDRCIDGGQLWNEKIIDEINDSQIVILLVSADFLASQFCYDIEYKLAEEKNKKIIPIIVRPCSWHLSSIGQYQAYPKDAKPIENFSNKDTAFTYIINKLNALIKSTFFLSKEDIKKNAILETKKRASIIFKNNLSSFVNKTFLNVESFFFFYIDLDKFTQMNRIHGSDICNNILKKIPRELKSFIKGYYPKIFIEKIHGDQFFVAIPKSTELKKEIISDIANKILFKIKNFKTPNPNVYLTASIGCCYFTYHLIIQYNRSQDEYCKTDYSFANSDFDAIISICQKNCLKIKSEGGDNFYFDNDTSLAYNEMEIDCWYRRLS